MSIRNFIKSLKLNGVSSVVVTTTFEYFIIDGKATPELGGESITT